MVISKELFHGSVTLGVESWVSNAQDLREGDTQEFF